MRSILILSLVAVLTGCASLGSRKASVTLEFRPGSESSGPGLTEMTVPGSERPVYISDDIALANRDVASARVVSRPDGHEVAIVFTEAGAHKFAEVTAELSKRWSDGIRRPLGIFVDGQLISAPLVREKISGGKAVIAGTFTEEEAERIANGIAGR